MLIQVQDVSDSQSEAFKDIKVGDHRIEGMVVGVFEVEVYRYQMIKIVFRQKFGRAQHYKCGNATCTCKQQFSSVKCTSWRPQTSFSLMSSFLTELKILFVQRSQIIAHRSCHVHSCKLDNENKCRKCPTKLEEGASLPDFRGKLYLASGDGVFTVKFWASNFERRYTELSDGNEIGDKIGAEFNGKRVQVDLNGELDEEEEISPIRIITTSG